VSGQGADQDADQEHDHKRQHILCVANGELQVRGPLSSVPAFLPTAPRSWPSPGSCSFKPCSQNRVRLENGHPLRCEKFQPQLRSCTKPKPALASDSQRHGHCKGCGRVSGRHRIEGAIDFGRKHAERPPKCVVPLRMRGRRPTRRFTSWTETPARVSAALPAPPSTARPGTHSEYVRRVVSESRLKPRWPC